MPDLDHSYAVLVGYGHGGPSTGAQSPPEMLAGSLAAALSSPGGGAAFRDAHVEVLGERKSPAQVLDAVQRAADAASDVLLFYYAGRGVPHEEFLHGGMAAVAELMSNSRAVRPIVILDCAGPSEACFTRKSLSWHTDLSKVLTLLTATCSYQQVDRFTSTLVYGLTAGVEDGPQALDLPTLETAITASHQQDLAYQDTDHPIGPPDLWLTGGHGLVLGMNPAFGSEGRPGRHPRRPGLPRDQDAVLDSL
jgi:hypothetical protein